jgi:hypothetical protein
MSFGEPLNLLLVDINTREFLAVFVEQGHGEMPMPAALVRFEVGCLAVSCFL